MKLTIENMQKSDISAVSAILIEAFNQPPINESWTPETASKHIEESMTESVSFVAKEEGTIIGALVGNISTFDTGPVFFIDALIVKEEKRGHGVGEKLIDKALETAKKEGFTKISLESGPHLRAFHWYKELGFKESGWVELVKTLV